MSLVSGPGRGGGTTVGFHPDGLSLAVDRHVEYIQKLDTVRTCKSPTLHRLMVTAQG